MCMNYVTLVLPLVPHSCDVRSPGRSVGRRKLEQFTLPETNKRTLCFTLVVDTPFTFRLRINCRVAQLLYYICIQEMYKSTHPNGTCRTRFIVHPFWQTHSSSSSTSSSSSSSSACQCYQQEQRDPQHGVSNTARSQSIG